MSTLYLDFETYSEADLPKVGGYVYATHPSTECLLLSFALDDAPAQVWDPASDLFCPDELVNALRDPEVELVAHNAQFDRWILEHVIPCPTAITRWRCTMAKAYTMGLPGKLEQLGTALGLSDDLQKMSEGKKLIRMFCMPQPKNHKARRRDRHTDPEAWATFKEYALRDTESLREIDKRIPNWNYRGAELSLWHLDQRINDRGLPIDLKLAKKAAVLCDIELERLNAELYALTDGAVTAHSKRDDMLAWLATQGVSAKGYTKADVSGLLERPLPPLARRALEIRQEAGRTSTAKYVRFGQATHRDGRLRGGFQYGGAARTLRWSGRLVQPQNFARPTIEDTDTAALAILNDTADLLYPSLMEVAASNMRSVIAAKPGYKLTPGDYSNIEGRMLAWLAGEEWKLQAFRDFDTVIGTDDKGKPIRKGYDLYKLTYSRAFGKPVEVLGGDERMVGKVQDLSLGFQGAVGALRGMAKNLGIDLPEDDVLVGWVKAWRKAHQHVVSWWYELEAAATHAIRNPGKAFRARKVAFKVVGKWLLLQLPSGRFVPYYNPRLTRSGIQYEGLDQKTRRWIHLDTFGGKLCENAVSASARDILAYNMPLCETAGYLIVGTVHDEIISEVPDTEDFTKAGMEKAMGHVPPWCPDLPLAVEAYETRRYKK